MNKGKDTGKKIIFYGGVQGSNKTSLLESVLKEFYGNYESDFEIIRISKLFKNQLESNSQGSNPSAPILWGEVNWKHYDEEVVGELIKKIRDLEKVCVLNGHFSIPFREKNNYLPGLEMCSLENLIRGVFFNSNNELLSSVQEPCFGVVLVEPEPSAILSFHKKKYGKTEEYNSALFYFSEQLIQKDLEENRNWSNQYYNTACSILGEENVRRKTIYLFQDHNDLKEARQQMKSFFDMFLQLNEDK